MTVQEYAHKHNISERTVYRMLERGEISGQKVGGKWTVIDNTDEVDKLFDTNEQLVRQLQEKQDEIEYLRAELSQANQTISDMQQRHDMIVMSFTKQLEQQTLLIEDMRGKFVSVPPALKRSLWSRVKTAFGFAVNGLL
jgi:excisionase family DNA binding protein